MRIGIKLWSENDSVAVDCIKKLYTDGYFDYIELFVVPGSFRAVVDVWASLDVPYYLHAPHSGSGLNLSLRELEGSNAVLLDEVEMYFKALKPERVIFHPGIDGHVRETIRQINVFKKKNFKHFGAALIENKPRVGLNEELCIGSSFEEIQSIINETGFGFCLDIGHAVYYAKWAGKSYFQVVEDFLQLNPHMIHLSDGDQESVKDVHLNYGMGNFDILELLRILPSDSTITIETPRSHNDYGKFIDDASFLKSIRINS